MIKRLLTFSTLLFISTVLISQSEKLAIDSFLLQKEKLERKYEVESYQFDSLLVDLTQHGDIHQYVMDNLDENRRSPFMHEYYPAFLSFINNNMDSIYQEKVFELINSDSIEISKAFPLVKSCHNYNMTRTCEFLISQNLEEKFKQTRSPLFEGLMLLKNELNCSL